MRRAAVRARWSGDPSAITERDHPHEVFERFPQIASGRGFGRRERSGEDARERHPPALEHVDHVERLREHERVVPERGAERTALGVGDPRDVDDELLSEGDAQFRPRIGRGRVLAGDR